jgi:hypothetical protein
MRVSFVLLPVLMLFIAGCSSSALPGAVNADGSASLAPHGGGLVVKIATAEKPPIHMRKGGTSAFAVAAKDESAAYRNVTVQVSVGKLPLGAALCQSNEVGQCLSAPSASVRASIRHNEVATFSVFLTATGSIALGTVRVDFYEKGALIGSGNVTVTTKS